LPGGDVAAVLEVLRDVFRSVIPILESLAAESTLLSPIVIAQGPGGGMAFAAYAVFLSKVPMEKVLSSKSLSVIPSRRTGARNWIRALKADETYPGPVYFFVPFPIPEKAA